MRNLRSLPCSTSSQSSETSLSRRSVAFHELIDALRLSHWIKTPQLVHLPIYSVILDKELENSKNVAQGVVEDAYACGFTRVAVRGIFTYIVSKFAGTPNVWQCRVSHSRGASVFLCLFRLG